MTSRSKFKTLIMLDLETTGLIYERPKITELAMIAVNIETLEAMKPEEELPRVLNKFVKFFDPVKLLSTTVAELTGLTNRMLIDYAPFNRETVIAMEAFLNDLQKPMCFVAHNGNLYDFPILFDEIRSALSDPVFSNKNNNECHEESITTVSNDQMSSLSPLTKDISVQTITSSADYDQTVLLSIDCADSLVFFRQMHQLLNDKDLVQYPDENIPSESSTASNQTNTCNNNASVDSSETPSTPVLSVDNNSSHSRLGYIEIPVKYTPSPDPLRQRPSLKLSKIYERECNPDTLRLQAHRAEDDCLMLLAILKRYLPDWLDWIEVNHRPLNQFPCLPLQTSTTTKQSSPNTAGNRKRPLKF